MSETFPWRILLLKLAALLSFCGGPLVMADLLKLRTDRDIAFAIAFVPIVALVFGLYSLSHAIHDLWDKWMVSFMSRTGALALLATAFASSQPAIADSWPAATVKAVASANGEIVVRVTPGSSLGDTYGFAGAPKGAFASAQWFRFRANRYDAYQTAPLLNPVAPIHVAVANDGTLVTLDNWHNVGFGYIVVIYSPDGGVRRRYRLEDLYSAGEVEKIKRSVSSRWWRCLDGDPLIEPNGTLRVDAALGRRFTFRLESGAYTLDSAPKVCTP